MLKVLEAILGMRLNRFSILILTLVFACGASLNASAIAAAKDKDGQTKANKVTVKIAKSPKKPKLFVSL